MASSEGSMNHGGGDFALRVARQRLNSVAAELQRTWLPILAADIVLAAVVLDARRGWLVLGWLALMELLQWLRRRSAVGMTSVEGSDARAGLDRLVWWSAAIGVARASVVVLAFTSDDLTTQMLVTMIMIGLASGAVATCGGEVRIMLAWAVPAMGSLTVGWLAQFTWQGTLLAVLTAYLVRVLAGYVDELGTQGSDLLARADDLQRQHDQLHTANVALGHATEALRAERDKAAEANAAKSRVLASVSHDLRQPLFALSLNASALADVAAQMGDSQMARIESGLRRSLVQCRSLLDQLVDFSRLESGTLEVRLRDVPLSTLLANFAPPFEASARQRGLAWELEEADASLWIRTDPALFERVLGNLVHNAIKFTDEGKVGVRTSPSEGRSGQVCVEVFDTGPGIPLEDRERVFEAFYQLQNPARDHARGLGLGLSIVQGLARRLNIQVELHSTEGQGSRFALTVPAGDPGPVRREGTGSTAAAVAPAAAVVLCIDDQVGLLEDLELMLTGRGWQVRTACDIPQAAAKALKAPPPDVVLADFRLAGTVTGYDAVIAVREALGRAVPALIVTGDTAPSRIAEAHASGLRVLHKPIDGDELAAALREAVKRDFKGYARLPSPSGDISG